MSPRVLTLALAAALPLALPHYAFSAPKPLSAQLGFIVLCRTTMSEVTSRLGPGTLIRHDNEFVASEYVTRVWHNPARGIYLIVDWPAPEAYKRRGLAGGPPVVSLTITAETHKEPTSPVKVFGRPIKTLGRPRLALSSLSGPNGIKMGDPKDRIIRLLGKGSYSDGGGVRGNVETANYYDIMKPAPREGCGPAGFILQVSFTRGRLSNIYLREAS